MSDSETETLRRWSRALEQDNAVCTRRIHELQVEVQAYKQRAEAAEAKLELAQNHIGKVIVDVLEKALAVSEPSAGD